LNGRCGGKKSGAKKAEGGAKKAEGGMQKPAEEKML
jgi:hypothetical protein